MSDSIHAAYSPVPGYHEAMVKTYGEQRARQILGEVRHNTVYFPNIMVKGAVQILRNFISLTHETPSAREVAAERGDYDI